MMAAVCITLRNGQRLEHEIGSLEPPSWEWAQRKFDMLTSSYTSAEQRAAIVGVVANLERERVADLMTLLAAVKGPGHEMPRRAA
jgi:hypothetical protein